MFLFAIQGAYICQEDITTGQSANDVRFTYLETTFFFLFLLQFDYFSSTISACLVGVVSSTHLISRLA